MHEKHPNDKLRHLVYGGLFSALIALLTSLLHIPVGTGYVHCGDAILYLAATMLPLPYAIGAAAIGGMVADFLSGYAIYALPTFLIKGLLALVFHIVGRNRRMMGLILCGLLSILGYWLTAVLLYGGWQAQLLATVPANAMQAIASGIVYEVIVMALKKIPSANGKQ